MQKYLYNCIYIYAYLYIHIYIYIRIHIIYIFFAYIHIYTCIYLCGIIHARFNISCIYIYIHLFNHGYFLQSRRWCSFHLCPGHYTFNLCLGVVMDLGVIQKAGIDGVWSLNANRFFHSAEVFSHAKWHWGGKNRLDKYTVYFCLYK